jgi:presenilin enhancer 2
MDLARVPNERKLYLCRWYFKGGFLFLPFLWAINAVWFFKDAFKAPAFEEQPQIRKYVIRSGIGAVVWIVAVVAWAIVFQINRPSWGAIGDELSFVIPTGRA